MNILIDLLPDHVEIKGVECEINSDFRTSILFELLMQDKSISEEEKLISAIELYYKEVPSDLSEAINKIIWFYTCGKDAQTSKGTGKGKNIQVYSFEHDAEYIYSAFLDQYNINLQQVDYLHWWEFKAMFKGLTEEKEIVKIMGYRSVDINKIKDKEQKAHYKKLQKLYEIPIQQDEKEKLDEINKILLNGGDLGKVL